MDPVMTGPRLVLIGPPGSGKTSTARVVGDLLHSPVHDTDEAIEVSTGTDISEIFLVRGEAHFRELETAEVLRALAQERGILALGGGAPMSPVVEAALAGHRVVFLDVGIADAARRIGFDRSRPLLAVNPRASWVTLMKARRPIYERIAGLRVDTSGRTVDEVAAQIAQWVRG